jgi:hypothetical protein
MRHFAPVIDECSSQLITMDIPVWANSSDLVRVSELYLVSVSEADLLRVFSMNQWNRFIVCEWIVFSVS